MDEITYEKMLAELLLRDKKISFFCKKYNVSVDDILNAYAEVLKRKRDHEKFPQKANIARSIKKEATKDAQREYARKRYKALKGHPKEG